MLKVSNLVTSHGRNRVLKGINMEVWEGEMVSLIGANGAGKSTLLGTLAGLYRPEQGQVTLGGRCITSLSAHRVVKMGISLIPERREIFDALTVRDNIMLGAYHRYHRCRGSIKEEAGKVLGLFPALQGKEQRLAGTLSGGEQQMLAIARGLMAEPKVLMLDEPSVGLAPLVVKEIFAILAGLKEQGITILLVEQNARAALQCSDRAYVLERGEIIASGRADELLHDPMVQKAYLGQGAVSTREEKAVNF